MDTKVLIAAYTVFGRNGYKKASMSDIAQAAGVSKSVLFYHFGSKEKLYFHLLDFGVKLMYSKFSQNDADRATGFFEKLRLVSDSKLSVMREYPGMLQFFRGIMTEDDPCIAPKLEAFRKSNLNGGVEFFLSGIDATKFKEGIDPIMLFKFIAWATEGGVNSLPPNATEKDVDNFYQTFHGILNQMQKHFYK